MVGGLISWSVVLFLLFFPRLSTGWQKRAKMSELAYRELYCWNVALLYYVFYNVWTWGTDTRTCIFAHFVLLPVTRFFEFKFMPWLQWAGVLGWFKQTSVQVGSLMVFLWGRAEGVQMEFIFKDKDSVLSL